MCQTDSESKTETNTHVRKSNNKLINENNLHFVIISKSLSCVWTTAQEPCKLKVHRTHRISIHVYVCMHACVRVCINWPCALQIFYVYLVCCILSWHSMFRFSHGVMIATFALDPVFYYVICLCIFMF